MKLNWLIFTFLLLVAPIDSVFAQSFSPLISANVQRAGNATVRMYPGIHANAWHTHSDSDTDTFLTAERYSKPCILSTDGTNDYSSDIKYYGGTPYGASPETVLRWAQKIQTFSVTHSNRGAQHLEHNCPYLINQAEYDAAVGGWSTWPQATKDSFNNMKSYADELLPGGRLSQANGRFYWNGSPVQLMGISAFGSMHSQNFDYGAFLTAISEGPNNTPGLNDEPGCNLTRIWVIDQWCALSQLNPSAPLSTGISVFAGNYAAKNYDLNVINEAFISRLKDYVQKAWDRGIVVQITLSDRCGFESAYGLGGWTGNPYNSANNVHNFLNAALGGTNFLSTDPTTGVGQVNKRLYSRLAQELRGYGNVIIEIMNEPINRWSDSTINAWHLWVADMLAAALAPDPTPASRAVWLKLD